MGDVVARHFEAEYRNRNPVPDESNRPGAGTRKRNAQAEGNQMSDIIATLAIISVAITVVVAVMVAFSGKGEE